MPARNTKLSKTSRTICPILIGLMLYATGCAPKVETVVLTPPESMLMDCPRPEIPDAMMQTRDMREYARQATRYTVALNAALDMCNGDKAALRAWLRAVNMEIGDSAR